MKHLFRFSLILTFCLMTLSFSSKAQNPYTGTLYYNLPMTSFTVEIEADIETFNAGPFAGLASQYFDFPAQEKNSSKCNIKSIAIIPNEVIDNTQSYMVTLSTKNGSSEAFQALNGRGYVYVADTESKNAVKWEFNTSVNDNLFVGQGLDIQTVVKTKTVYEQIQTEEGVENVPVSKSEEVALDTHMKAEELARVISDLKQSRLDIITGNTDAEFQGEAMASVISEINRLIDQYSSLFYGVQTVDGQKRIFEVVPTQSNKKSLVVCRISDSKGILPSDSKEGRPITMSIITDDIKDNIVDGTETWLKGSAGIAIKYRIPAFSTIRIMDGETVLLEAHFPVFQFGSMSSVNI